MCEAVLPARPNMPERFWSLSPKTVQQRVTLACGAAVRYLTSCWTGRPRRSIAAIVAWYRI